MRLEKSVSKMGLRHLRCWTNGHFIKNIEFFEEKHDFRGCGFFEFFDNLDFWRFDPMILCSFLWRLRIKALESHNSKQMMVYEQITFFIKKQIFSKFVFDLKIDFLIEKSISGLRNRKQPEKNKKNQEK